MFTVAIPSRAHHVILKCNYVLLYVASLKSNVIHCMFKKIEVNVSYLVFTLDGCVFMVAYRQFSDTLRQSFKTTVTTSQQNQTLQFSNIFGKAPQIQVVQIQIFEFCQLREKRRKFFNFTSSQGKALQRVLEAKNVRRNGSEEVVMEIEDAQTRAPVDSVQ